MLSELSIAGLGVIERAEFEPDAGLTVVTGETGAGKTMVVTALGLVCGGRGDSGRVRSGVRKATVEARFCAADDDRAGHLVQSAEAVGGDTDDDGSLLAVRSVSADGRSRAHIGGRSVPVSSLAELAEPLVAVHGQAEAMTLLAPANQRAVLDRYAGTAPKLERYRSVRDEWLAVRAEIADRTGRARELAQREQMLRIGLEEIERVDPQPGEDADLLAEARRLGDADELRAQASEALAALTGADEADMPDEHPSAAGLAQQAMRALEGASDPQLRTRVEDLHAAVAQLGDIGTELAGYLGALDADPARLEEVLSRQAALKSLVRKYGDDVDAVLQWARDARAELAGLDNSDEALETLATRAAELESDMTAAAATLTAARTAAAAELSAAASAELTHLAMGTAALRVAVSPRDELAADGADHIEMLLRPRGDAPELPVAKGASGGELSRVMLALEAVLAGADPVATLVFDEVDAGVGGRAATEIGRRLAMLAHNHQVIVVTHLAQVAAFAAKHYVVDADAEGTVGASGASSVRLVDGDDRLTELARMLGGTSGDKARAHAADLFAAAQEAAV